MTQAYNLAILANAVDTSGRLNVGTNATGTLPVANGGTGLATTPTNGQLDIGNGSGFTRATLTAGSGISITNGAGSISIAATGSGTVTSVATGNGLQGGTITTTGTLSVACPAANTVGSYAAVTSRYEVSDFQRVFGSNYAGGNGYNSIGPGSVILQGGVTQIDFGASSLSGTWKWLSNTTNISLGADRLAVFGIACRVS